MCWIKPCHSPINRYRLVNNVCLLHDNVASAYTSEIIKQGTRILQYCTCPAGRVTYNFHLSWKHMHVSFKSVCNKEHKGVIWLHRVILPKALVLQGECFGKYYSSFPDFTRYSERTSGIFVPCKAISKVREDNCLGTPSSGHIQPPATFVLFLKLENVL